MRFAAAVKDNYLVFRGIGADNVEGSIARGSSMGQTAPTGFKTASLHDGAHALCPAGNKPGKLQTESLIQNDGLLLKPFSGREELLQEGL